MEIDPQIYLQDSREVYFDNENEEEDDEEEEEDGIDLDNLQEEEA